MTENEATFDTAQGAILDDAEVERLRKLSLRERGELIMKLSREAAIQEAKRIKA